jgi:hypothetical protein
MVGRFELLIIAALVSAVLSVVGLVLCVAWRRTRVKPMPLIPTAVNARRYCLAWAVFAVLCFGFVAIKNWQNRRDHAIRLQQQARQVQSHARYQGQVLESRERLRSLWQESSARPGPSGFTKAELEQRLGPQRPLPSTRSTAGGRPPRELTTYVLPGGGVPWELQFENDRWVGFSGPAATTPPAPASPPSPPSANAVEAGRRAFAWAGPVLWLGLLLASIAITSTGRPAVALAHLSLAAAVLCFVVWLTAPNYTLAGVFSNDRLFWGTLMVVCSAAVGLWVHRRNAALLRQLLERGLCTVCGYDLRASPGRCPECGRGATTPA